MYKYIVYHITIHKGNEYYRYEQKKKIPTTFWVDAIGGIKLGLI